MSDFLEKSVEAKIVAAVAAVVSGSQVLGWWQPALDGDTKRQTLSSVLVTVRPRSNESFGSKIVSLHGRIDIRSACADDPAGDKLSDLAGTVFGLLESWNKTAAAMVSALEVSGVFSPGGFIFTDGGDADYDDQQGCWFATVSFQVKGCIL